MVGISLDIPESIYDQIKKLSETFSHDFDETANELLDAACYDIEWLLESKKVDNIELGLRYKISLRIDSGRMADNRLFDKILKELNAEGHFRVGDMEIDLDDNSIWISYDDHIGSNLFVDSFDVTLSGLKSLTADCIIEVVEDDYETLGHIEEQAKRIKRSSKELPEELRNLDPWEIFVLAQDEFSICLRAHFSEENTENLPSIPAISELFETVLAACARARRL
jgi:hypothetical protein